MYNHCIILGSAYSIRSRIALHYVNLTSEKMKEKIDYITNKCGSDISISTHYLMTDKDTWKSVVDYDKYFLDVKLLSDVEEFSNLILCDRDLDGLDVARYIIAKIPCTHLKLEKLTYICYAEYLCETKKKLFNDNIYAYRLGPVVESVYKKYRRKAFDLVEDDKKLYDDAEKRAAIKSRIIASRNGLEKLTVIENTLKKYGDLTASELVNLTHRENSPWYISDRGESNNKIINDDIILKNHKYETI